MLLHTTKLMNSFTFKLTNSNLEKGSKKIKENMENSIIGGEGGVSEFHFPYPIFFHFFFAPNGLKIIFRL